MKRRTWKEQKSRAWDEMDRRVAARRARAEETMDSKERKQQAAASRAESRFAMEQAEASQRARFGMIESDLVASYGPESVNFRLCGGAPKLVVSMLSDAQELMFQGRFDEARKLLNRAKWVLIEHGGARL